MLQALEESTLASIGPDAFRPSQVLRVGHRLPEAICGPYLSCILDDWIYSFLTQACIIGLYPVEKRDSLTGVGKIEENGPSASKFKKGQRVIALGWGALQGQGTWQKYIVVPEDQLVDLPTSYPSVHHALLYSEFLLNSQVILVQDGQVWDVLWICAYKT